MKPLTRLIRTSILPFALALCVGGCLDDTYTGTPYATLRGVVASGRSPAVAIAGANVSIYRAGTSAATPVGQVTTDSGGGFSVRFPFPDDGSVYYAIVRKGTSAELAAILGSAIPESVTINEMTTVATAYAMAQFFAPSGEIAGPTLSLQVAAGMAENLVSAQHGEPSPVIQASPNADQTNAWRSLGTLSNILAACVQSRANACATLFAMTPFPDGGLPTTTLQAIENIARNPGANVVALFHLGEVLKAYEPSLTLLQGPESPDALQKLDAWTLAVKVNATAPGNADDCAFGGPGDLAFDKNGFAWVTVNVVQGTLGSADCFVVLKPDGRPADGSNGTVTSPVSGGGVLGGGFGVTIDLDGNIWYGNFGWGHVLPPAGSVSRFGPAGEVRSPPDGFIGGTHRVQGLATDQQNNIWAASYGNDSVVVFPGRSPLAPLPAYINVNSSQPFDVSIASDGSAWVAYTGSSNVAKFTIGSNALTRQFLTPLGSGDNPKGIVVDSQGFAWVAAGKTSTVYLLDPNGNIVKSLNGRGLNGPWGLQTDARDNVWVANFGRENVDEVRYRVVALCGTRAGACPPGLHTGDAITPPTGYTLPSAGSQVLLANGDPLYGKGAPPSFKPMMRLTSVNIDVAGNAWAINNYKPNFVNDVFVNPGGDGIVIFVGVAAPTKAPKVGPAQSP